MELVRRVDGSFRFTSQMEPCQAVGSKYIEVDKVFWEVTEENGYCLQWNTFRQGKKRCMKMFPIKEGYEFVTEDGKRQSTVKILKGNPNNL